MRLPEFFCFVFALFLALSVPALSQPDHVGVMGTYQPSYGDSGNGVTVGAILDASYALHEKFTLVGGLQLSADPKIYRNQNGGAARVRVLARYKLAPRFFLQGGGYWGGIYFNDTKNAQGQTVQDGYVKYNKGTPVAGAGFELANGKSMSVVADYVFHFKRKLYSRDNELSKTSRSVDGWTSGQRVGLKLIFDASPNSKIAYLFDAAYGRYVYNRNPGVYGSLGGIDHVSGALELSAGIAIKTGFR